MPRFNQESVESCVAMAPMEVANDDYPWLTSKLQIIPSFLVTLADGTGFRFGSIIGLSNSIRTIADNVPMIDSQNTQTTLFTGLPEVLRGRRATGISKIEKSNLPNATLFVASKNLASNAGLLFSVESPDSETGLSTVLRVGISTAKERYRLLGIMGINPVRSSRRQN